MRMVPMVLVGSIALVLSAIILSVPLMGQPDARSGDDDARWSAFYAGQCPNLIEGIPLVPQAKGSPPLSASLSSVVGYYDRSFPILGPPVPDRIPRLVKQAVMTLGWDTDETTIDGVYKLWYDVEARSSERFFAVSHKAPPPATEGTIRSYGLQAMDIGSVEALPRLARQRLQDVRIDRVPATPDGFRVGIMKKAPVVLVIDHGKATYTVVGLHERMAVVIDPGSAKSLALPAQQALLGEEDRKSTGEFASRAKALLKDEKVFIDDTTSCREKRPEGLQFVDPGRFKGSVDAYVIYWFTDFNAVQRQMKK
jgi:hypothetical protein